MGYLCWWPQRSQVGGTPSCDRLWRPKGTPKTCGFLDRRDALPSHHLVQAQPVRVGLPPHGPQQAVHILDHPLCGLVARHRRAHRHIQQPRRRFSDLLDLRGTRAAGEGAGGFYLATGDSSHVAEAGMSPKPRLSKQHPKWQLSHSPASAGGMRQAAGLLCAFPPVCASRHPPRCSPAPGCSLS